MNAVVEAPKACNCTSSGCLKLYCECFKNNRYCGGGCRCSCCSNQKEHEHKRLLAKEQILMRNPFAFRSKIEQQSASEADILTQGKIVLEDLCAGKESKEEKRHYKGCNCRRSGCQKKYCECYQQGVICSELCKCEGCKNCEEKSKPPSPSGTEFQTAAQTSASAGSKTGIYSPSSFEVAQKASNFLTTIRDI